MEENAACPTKRDVMLPPAMRSSPPTLRFVRCCEDSVNSPATHSAVLIVCSLACSVSTSRLPVVALMALAAVSSTNELEARLNDPRFTTLALSVSRRNVPLRMSRCPVASKVESTLLDVNVGVVSVICEERAGLRHAATAVSRSNTCRGERES